MLAGCWINIVGPHALQNSLLAAYLEEKTLAECHLLDTSQNETVLKITRRPTLTLIDSHEDDLEQALLVLGECRVNGPIDQHLAFFNAMHNGKLEKLVSPPDVQGIFYQDQAKEILYKGIEQIFKGELWFPRRILNRLILKESKYNTPLRNNHDHELLTHREMQILNLLSTGAKNAEIAQKMCLSIHTIKTHIYHIYKKIEVENRTQAVRWATHNL